MAERAGFEPTEAEYRLNRLATCRFKPLSHLSTVASKLTNESSIAEQTTGESRIRTHGPLRDNGFQDRRIRPLCHLPIFVAIIVACRKRFVKKNFRRKKKFFDRDYGLDNR